uniref:Uncharacterized protein n=1 Tax=Rhizophora mucronata TaxID=61149 RepID=A0A2P2NJ94_RHIMU
MSPLITKEGAMGKDVLVERKGAVVGHT